MHAFIDAHNTAATGIYGNNNSGFADDKRSMKITLDCWDDDYEVGGVKGNLNYTKYDLKKDDNTTVKLTDKLQSLYVQSDGENYTGDNIHKVIYAWISNAEQLNSVQRVAENMTDRNV